MATQAKPDPTKPSSSKRKRPSETTDSRFNFAEEDLDEVQENHHQEALGGEEDVGEEDAEDAEDEDDDQNDDMTTPSASASTSKSLPAHLLPSKGKSRTTPGLIYLSRIPPGMGPSKVKSLLSDYGEVGRVFLVRSDPDPPANASKKRKKEKHREHRFVEGWIEFMDKKVARSVAEMLNANPIGGKKGNRWRDDVWTMKYLPRFRWDQLSEQVALERATQTSLLRFHLQNSRAEQESYLSAVEQARVKDAITAKAESRRQGKADKGEDTADKSKGKDGKPKKPERERSYRQREVIDAGKKEARLGTQADLDGVLSRLF